MLGSLFLLILVMASMMFNFIAVYGFTQSETSFDDAPTIFTMIYSWLAVSLGCHIAVADELINRLNG